MRTANSLKIKREGNSKWITVDLLSGSVGSEIVAKWAPRKMAKAFSKQFKSGKQDGYIQVTAGVIHTKQFGDLWVEAGGANGKDPFDTSFVLMLSDPQERAIQSFVSSTSR